MSGNLTAQVKKLNKQVTKERLLFEVLTSANTQRKPNFKREKTWKGERKSL